MSRASVLATFIVACAISSFVRSQQTASPASQSRQSVDAIDGVPDGPMIELFLPAAISAAELDFLVWMASDDEGVRNCIRTWRRAADADDTAWRADILAALMRRSRELVKSHGTAPSLERAEAIARLFTDRDRAARVLFDRERVSLASHLAEAGLDGDTAAEVVSIVTLARRSGAMTGLGMWAPQSEVDLPRLLFAASRALSELDDAALRRCVLEIAPRSMEARISYADACVRSVPRGAMEAALEASGASGAAGSSAFRPIAIGWRRLAEINADLLDTCLVGQPVAVRDRLRREAHDALYGPLATDPYDLGPLCAELSLLHPAAADAIAEVCTEWAPRRRADQARVLAAFDAATGAFLERGLSPDRDAGRRFMGALEFWLSESTSTTNGASARLEALFEAPLKAPLKAGTDTDEESALAREAILQWRADGARATKRIAASPQVQTIVPAIRRMHVEPATPSRSAPSP